MGAEKNTPRTDDFRIVEVGLDSPFLEQIIDLHTAGKGRLGPFPRGAFIDHAERKTILVAITKDNVAAGYLLFRVAKNRAAIVHLTSSSNFRGKGVARFLVESLKTRTRHLLGMSLRCRRDYNINAMWQGFGFTVRHSKEGRGADGALLDYWWFDHNHEDLFSLTAVLDDSSERILTVVDANVFYDLTGENRPHSEDSKVLQADWLHDSILLCVTKEIYSEIHRCPNEADKKRSRAAAQEFFELKVSEDKVNALESELIPLFKGAILERDTSDMRQIAHAIAAEVPFFVTRDTPMLGRSDVVFERYGLRILHPTDLINRLDVLRRAAEYRPVRLEGSRWRERLVTAEDIDEVVALFKNRSKRSGGFEQLVRHYLVNPNSWSSSIVADDKQSPTLYFVQSKDSPSRLNVALLRHTSHPLTGTLVRHLIHELTRETGALKHRVMVVTDPELSHESIAALTELGFLHDANAWWKLSIAGVMTRDDMVCEIRRSEIPTSLKDRLVGAMLMADTSEDESARVRLEMLFSPAKLVSSLVPCYIVSIRQSWAAHFFDIPVGGQTLIDLKEKLHLGIEGAYYCSAHNTHVTAPGRILWYVSGRGSMSIKACSNLEQIVSGTPKQVYGQFRHLGIYAWKHVLETADGKLDHPLMAFRFSRTERFDRPVTLSELLKMGVPQPQNPRKITPEQFEAIYRLGMQL